MEEVIVVEVAVVAQTFLSRHDNVMFYATTVGVWMLLGLLLQFNCDDGSQAVVATVLHNAGATALEMVIEEQEVKSANPVELIECA